MARNELSWVASDVTSIATTAGFARGSYIVEGRLALCGQEFGRMLLADLEVSSMKRMILVGFGTLALTAGVFAQAPPAGNFDKALAAAPRQMKDGAMVVKWKADGSYDTLRPGTN